METFPTQFAPAERLTRAQIFAQPRPRLPVSRAVLDAMPFAIMVLNQQRQVVVANRALFTLTGLDEQGALGYRPGELLDCVHSTETRAGCGTTEFCSMCGAVQAIFASQNGRSASHECRISRRNGSALDLRVRASPIGQPAHNLTLFTLNDISDEKRRRALERIFFHDILNTAGGLRNASELIHRAGAQDTVELTSLIQELTESLIEEIIAQRTISAAENGELQLEISEFNGRELVQAVAAQYAAREIAATRQLLVDPSSGSFRLRSDRVLLRRVLGNMVKNALEASRPAQTVTIGCEESGGNGRFWVHNPGEMPREVQLQVFQRSFSTKGNGRGLGTYSIKLLGEQYLGGKVHFTSTRQNGTEFSIVLPLTPKRP